MPEKSQKLRDQFLEGMSHAACTVNVVTTDGCCGRAGVTVSAMSSVSADTPNPTLLVCVHHLSSAAQKIIDNGVFCVNVLRDDQGYISDTFAGRFGNTVDKFDCAQWTAMPSGAPRVADPLVGFDCRLNSSNLIGTHHVFLGEVTDIFVARRGSPLIYANRAYGIASRIDSTPQAALADSSIEPETLSIGCFFAIGPYFLPPIIKAVKNENPRQRLHLVEGDQRRMLEGLQSHEIEIALMYDFDLPNGLEVTRLAEITPYVLLAQGHPLAARSELTPQDLQDDPMILLDAPPSRDYFTGLLKDAGITPRIAYRSSSFETVRGMVGHGLGFTLLATKPASPMTYDGHALVNRRLHARVKPSIVVMAQRKNETLSDAARHFQMLCSSYFAAHHNELNRIE